MDPRESGRLISQQAKHVKVTDLVPRNLRVDTNRHELHRRWHAFPGHPTPDHPHLVDYIFVIDSLNFSFWSDHPCTINGQRGYAMLLEGLKRRDDIWSPAVYGKICLADLRELFVTDQNGCIPMIEERQSVLAENARILIERFGGTAESILKSLNSVAIVNTLSAHFPSFNDQGTFNGQSVSFMKRAQIFVADCYSASLDLGIEQIERLTMFADYRLPQALSHLGCLEYSDELVAAIKSKELIEPGSEFEVEIRGCSIEAVERISTAYGALPMAVDYALWESCIADDDHMMHRCRTIFY